MRYGLWLIDSGVWFGLGLMNKFSPMSYATQQEAADQIAQMSPDIRDKYEAREITEKSLLEGLPYPPGAADGHDLRDLDPEQPHL